MMSESMAGIYSQPDAFKVEENLSSIILEWEKIEGRILATTTSVANALEILGTNARYVSEQVGHMAEKLTAASAAMGALAASQQVGSGGVGDGVVMALSSIGPNLMSITYSDPPLQEGMERTRDNAPIAF